MNSRVIFQHFLRRSEKEFTEISKIIKTGRMEIWFQSPSILLGYKQNANSIKKYCIRQSKAS